MSKTILSEIDNLIIAKVISQETANDMKLYYSKNQGTTQNKLFVIFGIFGAILSGLGVILILAHNWDDLSNFTKSIISFLPLLIGQVFCGYTLIQKPNNLTWREASSVFLFVSIGASISLIAQIYNISGDFDKFLLTWYLLGLPLIYLMHSSTVSLLYLVGITFYCCQTNYFEYPKLQTNFWYFLLLIGFLPHYYLLLKKQTESNFTLFHNWFFAISLLVVLGIFAFDQQNWIWVAYISLLAIYYFIGKNDFFEKQDLKFNSFYIIGKLGTIFMLFQFSFNSFWESIFRHQTINLYQNIDFFVALLLSILALSLFIRKNKNFKMQDFHLVEIVFLINLIFIICGFSMTYLANILVLLIGLTEINRGNKLNNLGILNYGLAIITLLIICRFFDTDFSFAMRGLIFMIVGFGFFLTNYLMLKKRQENG
ncbi:MAG: DUF2157 domain-containing protein [Flavobacterium sp.]|nr:DUF2157 domain-containing protein [Flavobacterium sp.]